MMTHHDWYRKHWCYLITCSQHQTCEPSTFNMCAWSHVFQVFCRQIHMSPIFSSALLVLKMLWMKISLQIMALNGKVSRAVLSPLISFCEGKAKLIWPSELGFTFFILIPFQACNKPFLWKQNEQVMNSGRIPGLMTLMRLVMSDGICGQWHISQPTRPHVFPFTWPLDCKSTCGLGRDGGNWIRNIVDSGKESPITNVFSPFYCCIKKFNWTAKTCSLCFGEQRTQIAFLLFCIWVCC